MFKITDNSFKPFKHFVPLNRYAPLKPFPKLSLRQKTLLPRTRGGGLRWGFSRA